MTLRTHDGNRAQGTAYAVGIAAALPVLLMGVDAVATSITAARAVLWAAFGVVLFAILWPTRVTAAAGLLTSHGLVRSHHVHLGLLTSVAWHDGVSQRVILRDTEGNRLEFDPRLLVADPLLWHALRTGARTSADRGTLTTGRAALRQLSLRVERELARAVLPLPDATPPLPAPRRRQR
ncbi:hypothetical protein AB0I16_32885 [Streptomyces sp. NPDC050703]|uniref:hypothetical protein n=1 Tax=Streptomyces sp. NPDC050703 TaxID=3157218 RepID=UPI00341BC524